MYKKTCKTTKFIDFVNFKIQKKDYLYLFIRCPTTNKIIDTST